MRESFEVLDSSNSGTVNAAAVADMLDQMGMDNSTSALKDFFPPNAPAQLNLARYLDMLSAPLAELSHNDELMAAFEAWDVDDSGQIDVIELRAALLHTAAEPGNAQMSEREIDSILGEFASRRHFGGKGLNVAKGKGEVFRYKEFMASVSGGGADAGNGLEGVTAA
jgi:Ca2+-binding EF-hand superfamily protein